MSSDFDGAAVPSTSRAASALRDAFDAEWGRVVAAVMAAVRNWDLAEESAQEAFARAAERWPADGVPARPGAWLTTVAKRHAIDRLRRTSTEQTRMERLAVATGERTAAPPDVGEAPVEDDLLALIYSCCHPALPVTGRVALTLRTVLGLQVEEIARALGVGDATMSQRITRTKQKIRNAAVPLRMPAAHELPDRTADVLAVTYLLFTEGHAATSGAELVRGDLCAEAVHLARLLIGLMPDDPAPRDLLALLLLTDARRPARSTPDGDLVPLDEQDRTLWNAAATAEGLRLLDSTQRHAPPTRYRVQAEIAACHARASSIAETDWPRIVRSYEILLQDTPSPVIALNHAVAVAMRDGPDAGLALIEPLEAAGLLAEHHLLPATRADLQRRAGRTEQAAAAYSDALALARTGPERRYLQRRVDELRGTGMGAAPSRHRNVPGG